MLEEAHAGHPLVFLFPCLVNVGLFAAFWAGFRTDYAGEGPTDPAHAGHNPALPATASLAPGPVDA